MRHQPRSEPLQNHPEDREPTARADSSQRPRDGSRRSLAAGVLALIAAAAIVAVLAAVL